MPTISWCRGDKNFRPINLRWGPNGEIFVIDWHDQNPCSQADPDSWDYTHGRVYRIQKKGAVTKKAEDLGKKSDGKLVDLLAHHDPYVYRTVSRLLAERRTTWPRCCTAIWRIEWSMAISVRFGRWRPSTA